VRAGTTVVVDCGQISSFTAPDPVTPATGSLSIGLLPSWSIASDATVSASVAASLPGLVGTGPSCLALDLDSLGVITAMDFAAEGVISGAVPFDAGLPGYAFAHRLLIPTFITDAYPGLAAVFATSSAAGTIASATLLVDASNGQLTGIDATAAFCGPADLNGDGSGLVGAATIPASVLDAGNVEALADANLREACADVRTWGAVDQSGISLETDVEIDVDGPAPTPPDTATESAATSLPTTTGGSPIAWLALLALALLGLSAAARRRSG
jgi:hypothetical protein